VLILHVSSIWLPTGGGTPRVIAQGAGFVYSWSSDLSRVLTIKLPYDGSIYSLDTRTGKSRTHLINLAKNI
jgi:hypothetical protein